MNLRKGFEELWEISDNFTYLTRQTWPDGKGIYLIDHCTKICTESLNGNNTIDFEDAIATDYVLRKWELKKLKEVNSPVLQLENKKA